MERRALLHDIVLVFLISLGSVLCTNFPPVKNPIPIPAAPPPKVPLDFAPGTIFPAVPNFKPAERIPDSFAVTESTTEKLASDQVANEGGATGKDDWSPPSGTIGPVATPRPDGGTGVPFQPQNENIQFSMPPAQDNSGKPSLPTSIWLISRGITGQYSEQRWIPFDSSIPREKPTFGDVPAGRSTNPGVLPIFPTPIRPDLMVLPKGKFLENRPLWIPPSTSASNSPRSFPENGPPMMQNPPQTIFLIQNGSVPFVVQPPSTAINAQPPIEMKSNLFPSLQYFPKQIMFPVPKTFLLPNPPVNEVPMTIRPVQETAAPPEVVTPSPTTPQPVTLPQLPTASPPPTPPPPPPPPPPNYFILQSKGQPAVPPILIRPTPIKFDSPQIFRPVFPPKVNEANSFTNQYPIKYSPAQDKILVSPSATNIWASPPNSYLSQLPQQWYPRFSSEHKPPVFLPIGKQSQSPANYASENNDAPPFNSDLWIIKGPNVHQTATPVPVRVAIASLPASEVAVPVRGEALPPVLYQGVVPTFSGVQKSFPVYPRRFNSSRFYVLPSSFAKNVEPFSPQQGLYFVPSNQPSNFFLPKYNQGSSSQLTSLPFTYPFPFTPYPVSTQPSRSVPTGDDQNCTTSARQNRNYVPLPPSSFLVQPSSPVYMTLPQRQSAYSFVPARPSMQSLPVVVFQQPGGSRPSATTESPIVKEAENVKKELAPVTVPELPQRPTKVLPADNGVITPIFPFVSSPVALPKPSVMSKDTKRQPYYFGYNQRDGQGVLQYRREEADSDGAVKGSYGFRDRDGIYRNVDYTADKDGYNAVVRAIEPELLSQQSSDAVVKANESSFTGSTVDKNTPESEA